MNIAYKIQPGNATARAICAPVKVAPRGGRPGGGIPARGGAREGRRGERGGAAGGRFFFQKKPIYSSLLELARAPRIKKRCIGTGLRRL